MKKMEKLEVVTLSVEESKLVAGGGGEIYGEGTWSASSGGDAKVGIKWTF